MRRLRARRRTQAHGIRRRVARFDADRAAGHELVLLDEAQELRVLIE